MIDEVKILISSVLQWSKGEWFQVRWVWKEQETKSFLHGESSRYSKVGRQIYYTQKRERRQFLAGRKIMNGGYLLTNLF